MICKQLDVMDNILAQVLSELNTLSQLVKYSIAQDYIFPTFEAAGFNFSETSEMTNMMKKLINQWQRAESMNNNNNLHINHLLPYLLPLKYNKVMEGINVINCENGVISIKMDDVNNITNGGMLKESDILDKISMGYSQHITAQLMSYTIPPVAKHVKLHFDQQKSELNLLSKEYEDKYLTQGTDTMVEFMEKQIRSLNNPFTSLVITDVTKSRGPWSLSSVLMLTERTPTLQQEIYNHRQRIVDLYNRCMTGTEDVINITYIPLLYTARNNSIT